MASAFDTLPPDAQARIRITVTMWTQLIEMAIGGQLDRLPAVLVLYDGIEAYHRAELLEAFTNGYDHGTAFQHRLMCHDWEKGCVQATRQICANQGWPVPSWVTDLEGKIAQARAELEARRPSSKPVADVVH